VKIILPALLLLMSAAAAAQGDPVDNTEMTAIYEADQAPRAPGQSVDWEAVSKADSERRARTRVLIEEGALTTARDYYHAAYVFQHGSQPNDQLLGHVLAVRAAAMGMKEAEQIAAATLDRYLQNSGRSQIYGSQYSYSAETGVTMEPYDKTLIPDALRRAMGAPTLAEQEAQLGKAEADLKAALPASPKP